MELSKQQSSLEKEVDHWKTRYEVAQAYIDITREEEESEARRVRRNRRKREKKKQKKTSKQSPPHRENDS